MKSTKLSLLLLVLLSLFSACSNNSTTEENEIENTETTKEESNPEEEKTEHTSGEKIIVGTLTEYDHAGRQPDLFMGTIKTEEGKELFFEINDSWQHRDHIGKKCKVVYTSIEEVVTQDILYQGKSVNGEWSKYVENGNKPLDHWTKIEGILYAEKTDGDMPSECYLKMKNGDIFNFEYFVDPEMANLSEKEVILYHALKEYHTAISIEIK